MSTLDESRSLRARIAALEAELARVTRQQAALDAPNPAAAAVLESMSGGFVAFDCDYRYLWMNEEFARMLGMTREQLLGRTVWDVFPEARGCGFHESCERALQTQAPEEFESYYEHWDRWFLCRVYPSPKGLLAFTNDITAEKRLRRDAEMQSQMLAMTNDAVIGVDADQRVTFWNAAAERLYGLRAPEIIGKPLHTSHTYLWLSADDERSAQAALQQTGSWTGESIHFRRVGAPISVSSTVNVLPKQLGGGMIAVIRDITEGKRTQQEAVEQSERIRAITDVAPVLLYLFDLSSGRNLWINEALGQILGYDVAELQQMGPDLLAILLHPQDAERYKAHYARLRSLEDGETAQFEYRMRHKNGAWVWLLSHERAFRRDEAGCVVQIVGSAQDITDRKQAELELALAAERAEVAQQAASACLFEIQPKTGQVFRSARLHALVGYRSEELSPDRMAWRNLVHPDDLAAFDNAVSGTVSGGSDLSLEYRVRHKDGHWLWVADQARAVRDEQGAIERVVGFVSDITRRRHMQQALEESEARFRLMADACPTIIWVTNARGENEFINQAYRDFCGIGDENILAYNWPGLLHPEDTAYVEEFAAATREQRRFYGRCRMRRADGQWRWIVSHAVPRFSVDGAFLGHAGSSTEVHDLIITQQALEESEERFRNLADQMSQFAWMADGEGAIFWYNRRWYDYTGTTIEQMAGWGWRAVHHPEHVDRVVKHISHCFASGEPWEDTFPLRGKDGEYRWFLSRALPIRDEVGRILRWFGTNTDITHQLDIERELRRANQDLEQFAYSASHDLQEPLRNVAVYAQMLQREYSALLEGNGQRYLAYIHRGAQRMSRLLSDLLAYSRAGDNNDGSPPGWVSAGEVFEEVRLSLAQAIKESKAEVTCDGLPTVFLRAVHLELLFQNLIGNGLKYRRDDVPPRVHVRAEAGAGVWQFSVTDNGIGIDPQYQARIFGVFKRLHPPDEQKYPGTGIGLAICQRIVDQYGGRLWVESTLGQGSSFHFTIPKRAEA